MTGEVAFFHLIFRPEKIGLDISRPDLISLLDGKAPQFEMGVINVDPSLIDRRGRSRPVTSPIALRTGISTVVAVVRSTQFDRPDLLSRFFVQGHAHFPAISPDQCDRFAVSHRKGTEAKWRGGLPMQLQLTSYFERGVCLAIKTGAPVLRPILCKAWLDNKQDDEPWEDVNQTC